MQFSFYKKIIPDHEKLQGIDKPKPKLPKIKQKYLKNGNKDFFHHKIFEIFIKNRSRNHYCFCYKKFFFFYDFWGGGARGGGGGGRGGGGGGGAGARPGRGL